MRIIVSICVLSLVLSVALGDDSTTHCSLAELKTYSDLQARLYPKKDGIYDKVIALFGKKQAYTVAEITAATNPFMKVPFDEYLARRAESRKGMPVGAISQAAARDQLASYEKLHPKSTNLLEVLVTNYGNHPWYRADELRDVEESGKAGARQMNDLTTDESVVSALIDGKTRDKGFEEGFKGLMIRQSWRDVLSAEDPSQKDPGAKAIKDLVGATFTYAHDGAANANTWSANGAVLFPWIMPNGSLESGLVPSRFAFAPSVNINRLDTDGDPKKEADSLLFRAGIYGNWYLSESKIVSMQVRAAAVYATDTGFRSDLPGYEIDIEPQWQHEIFPLGYKHIAIRKVPELEGQTDNSVLDWQVRFWLHTEGGEVQNAGKSWDPALGSFFRLGPAIQGQLNAPRLVFGKDFSITAQYSYLEAISGSNLHNSFYKISAVLDLFKDESTNRKVSLTGEYQRGGLNLTKEDVDSVTVGIGFLY